jgi:hypothetical protein
MAAMPGGMADGVKSASALLAARAETGLPGASAMVSGAQQIAQLTHRGQQSVSRPGAGVAKPDPAAAVGVAKTLIS